MKERFDKTIYTVRQICGYSQDQFARMIGISRAYLNAIENEKCRISKTIYMAVIGLIYKEIEAGHDELRVFL